MSVTTVEDHVDSLLDQQVTEVKTGGVPNATIEAQAVFNSVALNLLLKPRAALFFSVLARNGLQNAVQDELVALTLLQQDIQDLGNVSFQIQGTDSLQQARTALLQLERLPRISSSNPTLQLFQNSINDFLNNQLAKNVRRAGSTDLVRPANEAQQDLINDFQSLESLHSDMLARLYSLAVGVDNFISAPFAALIGTTTVSRARLDLEDILQQVEASGDPSPARDYAVRILSSQATITTISSPPSPFDPLLPDGSTGHSDVSAAAATSAVGPFLLGTTPVFAVTVNGESESFNFFAGDSAILVSAPIVFPLTIPINHGLFFLVDGTARAVPLSGTYSTIAQLVAAFIGAISWVHATQFANDSSRLMLSFPGAAQAEISLLYSPSLSILSANAFCGFTVGQTGTQYVSAQNVVDALNSLFTLITAQVFPTGEIQVITVATAPGTTLSISAPSSFSFANAIAQSSSVILNGVSDHRDLVQIGDQLQFGNQKGIVSDVQQGSIEIDSAIPSYSGAVTGTSALVLSYQLFIGELKAFLRRWSVLSYAANLDVIDRVLAPLGASTTPGQRNMATIEIQKLADVLSSLLNLLSDQSTMPPDGAGQEERAVVAGILATLQERHYDRAADLLLRCDIQALIGMDADQASYGGNFMQAASLFAQANLNNEDPEDSDTPSAVSAGHN